MSSAPSDATMIEQHARVIVRCRIIDGGVGTNGAPPRGSIEIVESLLTGLVLGPRAAMFEPSTMASWYLLRSGGSAALAEWHARPLHGPAAGQAMILVAEINPRTDTLHVWDRCRFPDTEERRAFVAACLARRDEAIARASRTTTIIVTKGEGPDEWEELSLEERRSTSLGWHTMARCTGSAPDTFFMKALDLDLGVFASPDVRDGEYVLQSQLIDRETLREVLPDLEDALGPSRDRTVRALHARSPDESEERIAVALCLGSTGPDSGPAEEAASFIYQLAAEARFAISFHMGLGWELRDPAA